MKFLLELLHMLSLGYINAIGCDIESVKIYEKNMGRQ